MSAVHKLEAPLSVAAEDRGLEARLASREAELGRRTADLSALLEASQNLHNQLDVVEVSRYLASVAAKRLEASQAAVFLLDQTTSKMHLRFTIGLRSQTEEVTVPLGHRLVLAVLAEAQVVRRHPHSAGERLPDELDGFVPDLVSPLFAKGQLVGLLLLGALPRRDVAEAKAQDRFVSALCVQAAAAIATAHVYESAIKQRSELERSIHHLSMLFDITRALSAASDLTNLLKLILDRAIESVGAEKGSLMLYDDTTDELIVRVVHGLPDKEAERRINDGELECGRFRPGQGVAGRVFLKRKTMRLDDVEMRAEFESRTSSFVRSIICVPLISDDEAIGVINITNRLGEEPFSEEDEGILEALGSQAAVAIARTKLWEAAITDGLTRLFIRRFILHRLKEEIRRARRYGHHLSIVMADIDHFKAVNDTYGHQAGDEVLAKVAGALKAGLRENVDLPGRYGGEEFLLVLPETPADGAAIVAERLRTRIAELAIVAGGDPLTVTCSFGVAQVDGKRETAEELIARADAALYRAKHLGRDRVEQG